MPKSASLFDPNSLIKRYNFFWAYHGTFFAYQNLFWCKEVENWHDASKKRQLPIIESNGNQLFLNAWMCLRKITLKTMLASNWDREDFTTSWMLPGFGVACVFSLVAGFSLVFISSSIARVKQSILVFEVCLIQLKGLFFCFCWRLFFAKMATDKRLQKIFAGELKFQTTWDWQPKQKLILIGNKNMPTFPWILCLDDACFYVKKTLVWFDLKFCWNFERRKGAKVNKLHKERQNVLLTEAASYNSSK